MLCIIFQYAHQSNNFKLSHYPEDWDLWLRLAFTGVHVHGTSEALMLYRFHPNSLSARRLQCFEHNVRVLQKHSATVTAKFPKMRDHYRRSLEATQNYRDQLAAQMVLHDTKALSNVVFEVWRRHRNLRWLRWYLFLKWPLWLGGSITCDYVRRRIPKPRLENPKNIWAVEAAHKAAIDD